MLFMCTDDLLLETYCWVDDEIKGLKLRARGPAPTLSDSEVLAMEVVGEWLGLDQDCHLFQFFRRYHMAEFPALGQIDRTTFVRQAANLWWVATQLCHRLSQRLLGHCPFWILDSVSVPVCRLERVDRCRRFAGLAHCSREHNHGGFYYGFRVHLRVSPEGVIGQVGLAPAQVSDLAMTEELLPPGGGLCLGDRNYWSPFRCDALAQRGWQLEAPFRRRKQDPAPWPECGNEWRPPSDN
jgi:Transposase DDE domain